MLIALGKSKSRIKQYQEVSSVLQEGQGRG
jgi:hypothetical protein